MELSPDQSSLPAELRGLELDAIAKGPDGTGIVFEVVTRRALQRQTKGEVIARLRSIVVRMPGWDLELLVAPDSPPHLASEEEIESRLEAALLLAPQYPAPAFLTAFSALEWQLAKLALAGGIDYEPNAQRMAARLIEGGLLGGDVNDPIRHFQSLRNAIVHAAEVSMPTMQDLETMMVLVNQIRAERQLIARNVSE